MCCTVASCSAVEPSAPAPAMASVTDTPKGEGEVLARFSAVAW
jgi:hypothetical protein